MGRWFAMGSLPPIMLVDDDPDDLFIMQRLLVKAGVQNKTETFEDPQAGLDHLGREITNPDPRFMPCVLFCDLDMPEMSGFEVIKWIRAQPALSGLVVIMVSHSSSPDDEKRALELGAKRFLQKYPTSAGLRLLFPTFGCEKLVTVPPSVT
jgi:CheY-like chemotaxis protein